MKTYSIFVLLIPTITAYTSGSFSIHSVKSVVPKWIRITNDGGYSNVTVDYDSRYPVQCFWWMNLRRVLDGDEDTTVDHQWSWFKSYRVRGRYTTSYSIVDITRTSISFPSYLTVTSLKVQFVSDVLDMFLDINTVPLTPGKSVVEYVPEVEFKMYPSGSITYGDDEDLVLRFLFTDMNREYHELDEMQAEFITMDDSTAPLVNYYFSDSGRNFPKLTTPKWGSENLSSIEIQFLDEPNAKLGRIDVPFAEQGHRPRGLLKVTAGYRSRSCHLFAGVKVTRTSFLNPPPSEFRIYFPEGKVAFPYHVQNMYAECYSNLDLSVKAFGGKLKWRTETATNVLEFPEVWMEKNGVNVTSSAVIKRLFETEVIFRLRSITHDIFGQYSAFAKVDGDMATMEINVISIGTNNGNLGC